MSDLTQHAPNGDFMRTPEQISLDNRAAEMRSLGWTYQQIGEAMGVSRQAAHQAVRRAVDEIPKEGAEEVLKMELRKIDRLERFYHSVMNKTHYRVGNNGRVVTFLDEDTGEEIRLIDEGPRMEAANGLLRVQAQRAKLLGLNAPVLTKGEMVVYDIESDTAKMIEAQTRALEAMGLNDRVDEFRVLFVSALTGGDPSSNKQPAIEAVVVSES